ncbi:MAG: ATP-binding protein [Bacteroidota bacterium]
MFSLFAIYYFSAKHQKDEFYSRLSARANTTADLLIRVEQIDSAMLKLFDSNKKDNLYYENISVYNSRNKELYTNNDSIHFHKILPDLNSFLEEVRIYGEKRTSIGDIEIIGIQYQNENTKFVVLACAIDKYGLENLQNLKQILVIVFVVVLVVFLIVGWIYSGRALKPISRIVTQVNTITANNLNKRLDEGNQKDEIARLSATFNKMLDRIELAFKTQKTFVTNASHELRNPLTSITAQLEVTLLKERNTTEYKNIISSVLEDIKRLNEMSHQLLQLTKIDAENINLKMEVIKIDDLIWETKNEFLANNSGCIVKLIVHESAGNENSLSIPGNKQYLKTCFLNLMDNACKFSLDRTAIVEIISDYENLYVRFRDKGIGISENEIPHIFEPFYRGKYTTHVKGYGIGLSIVDKVVRAHKAGIDVSSTINDGTKITISFPLKF